MPVLIQSRSSVPRSVVRPPKSPHDAPHGPVIRSALQPNHHANPAKTAESRISAPRTASSQTAAGAVSSFFASLIGGEGTPLTVGWSAAGGAGGGADAAGEVAVGGTGVGVEGTGADALGVGVADVGVGGAAGVAAATCFLPQSAPRSRADWSASRKEGAYCSTSGGVCFSAFASCLSEKRQGLIVPVRLYSR